MSVVDGPRQSIEDLNAFHATADPWGYKSNPEDRKRLAILLAELPQRPYLRVLDLGCGQGFLTGDLPGDEIIGVDVSSEAIRHARRHARPGVRFEQVDLFALTNVFREPFDLIVITGVLYPQYIGRAYTLVYQIVDDLLAENGVLAAVHIDEWYCARFPYLMSAIHFYPYREFTHRLEIYGK